MIISVLIIGFAIYILSSKIIFAPENKTDDLLKLQTRTNTDGSVTVTVTSKDVSNKSETWVFEVVLDTHSFELNQDLVQTSVLVDDKGNEYKPVSWQGDPPGGHHRQGVLSFKSISPRPKSIELKIREVGGIKERIFKW